MKTDGGIDAITDIHWETLYVDNKVSLAIRFISLKTGETEFLMRNKYLDVEA